MAVNYPDREGIFYLELNTNKAKNFTEKKLS